MLSSNNLIYRSYWSNISEYSTQLNEQINQKCTCYTPAVLV